ncbi:MAG: hypothetical protein LBK41_01870 [Clostridiales bacterium]|nr:hypothetical protein [Clostridiales bacterium]
MLAEQTFAIVVTILSAIMVPGVSEAAVAGIGLTASRLLPTAYLAVMLRRGEGLPIPRISLRLRS